jgi:branched-subunit amino acid aminotransferase/4-amino-4-deoxychorismate lyase
MTFNYFSKNGKMFPSIEAVVPLSSVEYSYGFGVYESIRVARSTPFFIDDHIVRLMESARIIGLEHVFTGKDVKRNVKEVIAVNDAQNCNVKILLIGASKKEDAQLLVMCLNPLFPDRKLYRDGAIVTTYH